MAHWTQVSQTTVVSAPVTPQVCDSPELGAPEGLAWNPQPELWPAAGGQKPLSRPNLLFLGCPLWGPASHWVMSWVHESLSGSVSLLSGNPVTCFTRKHLRLFSRGRGSRGSLAIQAGSSLRLGGESSQAHTSTSLPTSRIAPVQRFLLSHLPDVSHPCGWRSSSASASPVFPRIYLEAQLSASPTLWPPPPLCPPGTSAWRVCFCSHSPSSPYCFKDNTQVLDVVPKAPGVQACCPHLTSRLFSLLTVF